MLRPLAYIVPSLLFGAAGGFFVGRSTHQPAPAAQPMGQSGPVADAPVSVAGPTRAVQVDYDRLAIACAKAAAQGSFAAPKVEEPPTEEQKQAEAELLELEQLALRQSKWSFAMALKAKPILRRVHPTARAEFGERMKEQVSSGLIQLQDGASLPSSE